jgi:hypothetical protein
MDATRISREPGERPEDQRVVIMGEGYWDDIYDAARLLSERGATAAVVDLGVDDFPDHEDALDGANESEFAVIDRIGDQPVLESWADRGLDPLKQALWEALAGPPTAVVLGAVPDLPVGAGSSKVVELAPEVVVLGSDRPRLDETVRRLFFRSPPVDFSALAIGRLRVPMVPDATAPWPGPVAQLLTEAGFGRPVTLAGLDRLAVRRRRSGADALAGRTWRPVGGTEVKAGCLIADAGDLGLSWKWRDKVRRAWGSRLVDLREQGIDGVLVSMENGFGGYDAAGPRRPHAVRLGVLSDAFDSDGTYEPVAELTCNSGGLFFDSLRAVRGVTGMTIEVEPGSVWLVEKFGLDGVRVRRVDAHRDITQITLRRGPCYGWCPIFELTLRRDGKARWHGERFCEPLGDETGTISPSAFERVARAVIDEGFDDWPPVLGRGGVTDVPDHELAVARGRAHRRVVQRDPYEPPGFERIAAAAEAVARRLGWDPSPGG